MQYIKLSQPHTELETMLCAKAQEMVHSTTEIMNTVDLFVALSMYKLSLQTSPLSGQSIAKKSDDRVQINLYKADGYRGIRIFHIGEHVNTALILE